MKEDKLMDDIKIYKKFVKNVLLKHFVHGYEQGFISGEIHSPNCRLCKVLKELEME